MTVPRARRTTSVDVVGCTEPSGDLKIRAAGQDVVVHADSTTTVVGSGELSGLLTRGDRRLAGLEIRDASAALHEALNAQPVSSGHRKRVADAIDAGLVKRASITHQLLDELPVVNIITSYVIRRSSQVSQISFSDLRQRVGVCAGWRPDGVVAVSLLRTGRPAQSTGPVAATLAELDPSAAWHELPELPPGSVRRVRSLDVEASDAGSVLARAWFRDVAATDLGPTLVIHEYGLTCSIDQGGTITALDVEPRVLPFGDCFAAPAGAAAVIGRSLAEVDPLVRAQLRGVASCTHLNDQLRSLGGIVQLEHAVRNTPHRTAAG